MGEGRNYVHTITTLNLSIFHVDNKIQECCRSWSTHVVGTRSTHHLESEERESK
jgi:hypothetical protein